ncbi:MAG: ABC transporter permease [Candidatus Bathyarchaeia archaeon]|nr:ABC transporter permease [Candidatus Bathyarchaeota archaeon]
MIGYLIKKLIQYFIVFFIILVVIFALPRLMPGNPADYLISSTTLTIGETSEILRMQLIERFGLNKSVTEQFMLFIANTFSGYLGVSWRYFPKEVFTLIMERLPWTMLIVVLSRIISLFLGYFVGIIAAWKRGGKMDITLQTLGLVSMSLPSFWVALVLLTIFAFYIPIFPLGGALEAGKIYKSIWDFISDALYHAALPVITLSIVTFFLDALIMRNTMLEILGEDFILTAEAKGLKDRTIMINHAARNAVLPFITGALMSFGLLVTGAIFVETAFSYPGIGMLLAESFFSRDFPTAQGILIITSLIFIVSNFLADIIYMWLDPRIRLMGSR